MKIFNSDDLKQLLDEGYLFFVVYHPDIVEESESKLVVTPFKDSKQAEDFSLSVPQGIVYTTENDDWDWPILELANGVDEINVYLNILPEAHSVN
jgi:hypothetical protein